MERRRWRAYDPETGTHLATGQYPDEPPEDARVVNDEIEESDFRDDDPAEEDAHD